MKETRSALGFLAESKPRISKQEYSHVRPVVLEGIVKGMLPMLCVMLSRKVMSISVTLYRYISFARVC